MLQPLQLIQPATVQEASQALAEFGDKAKLYAGGAELLLLLRNGLLDAEILIDVKKIERLRSVNSDNGLLRIGACVTHHELATNQLSENMRLPSRMPNRRSPISVCAIKARSAAISRSTIRIPIQARFCWFITLR